MPYCLSRISLCLPDGTLTPFKLLEPTFSKSTSYRTVCTKYPFPWSTTSKLIRLRGRYLVQDSSTQEEAEWSLQRLQTCPCIEVKVNFKDVLNLQSVLFSYPLLGKSFKCSSFCPDNRRLRTLRDNNFNSNCIDIFIKFWKYTNSTHSKYLNFYSLITS